MENNPHQPYEMWFFDKSGLTIEEQAMLYEHLRVCSRCQQMQQGWEEIMQQIRQLRMAKPDEGFSQRWRNSIDIRRAKQLQMQTIKTIMLLSFAAIISLSILVLQVGSGTPFKIFLSMIKIFTELVAGVFIIIRMVASAFQIMSPLTAVPIVILLVGLFVFLLQMWVSTYNKVSKKGVYK